MAREATLFEDSAGSPLRGYLLLKAQKSGNIPPSWLDRSRKSRKDREKQAAKALQEGRIPDLILLENWELAYRKECFYYGMRVLLELERSGKSQL